MHSFWSSSRAGSLPPPLAVCPRASPEQGEAHQVALAIPCSGLALGNAQGQPQCRTHSPPSQLGHCTGPCKKPVQTLLLRASDRKPSRRPHSAEVNREGPASLGLWFLFLPVFGPFPPLARNLSKCNTQASDRGCHKVRAASSAPLPLQGLAHKTHLPEEFSPSCQTTLDSSQRGALVPKGGVA